MISSTTWDTLSRAGFEREEKPDGHMPELPSDVTELTDAVLMSLYRDYVQWGCYAAALLVDAEAEEAAARQALAVVTAQAQVKATSERTVAGRRAAAAAEIEVQEAEEARLHYACLARGLGLVSKNAETRAQLLSRELSRRLARHQREDRAGRWAT